MRPTFYSLTITLTFVFSLVNSALAQDNYEDSVKALLEGTNISDFERAEIYHNLSLFRYTQGLQKEAVEYAISALDFCSEDDHMIKAQILNTLGNSYAILAQYQTSTKYYLEAIKEGEIAQSNFVSHGTYMNIGLNYAELKDFNKAESYYKKSIDGYNPENLEDSMFFAIYYGNAGRCLIHKEQFQLAEDTILRGLELSTHLFETHYLMNINELINLYTVWGKYDQAEEYISKADSMLTFANEPLTRIQFYNAKTKHSIFTNNFELALEEANYTCELADSFNFAIEKLQALENIIKINKALGNSEEALSAHHKFTEFNDSLFNNIELNDISEILMNNDLEQQKEQQLKIVQLAEKEKQVLQYRWIALTITILLITLIVAFFTFRMFSKRKLTELKLNNSKLSSTALQNEIDQQGTEIKKFNHYLEDKNIFLENLQRELINLKVNNPDLNIRPINTTIKQHLSESKQRRQTTGQSERINTNFFFNLEQKFPKLTLKDKRLCSLILKGFSSREIAQEFNIATSSVEKSRHRLRKKLELAKDESLIEFLKSMQ